MNVFVDTSALYAVLDRDDAQHARAAQTWRRIIPEGVPLVTSNYVMLETTALLQARIGPEAVRILQQDVLGVMSVEWVTAETHGAALQRLLHSGRRKVSLVDCTSFVIMERLGIEHAFAFDRHFRDFGFALV